MRRTALLMLSAALIAVAPAEAAIEVSGWRSVYATPLALGDGDNGEPRPIRLAGRAGPAGIDQSIPAPRGRFAVAVRGSANGRGGVLVLEWSRGARVVDQVRRPLTLPGGRQGLSATSPGGASFLRILLLHKGDTGHLDIDEIRLTAAGTQLENPTLDYRCGRQRELPEWRNRYAERPVVVDVSERSQPLVRLRATSGPVGIDQFVRPRAGTLRLDVDGRVLRGTAVVVAELSRDGNVVRSVRRPLRQEVEHHSFEFVTTDSDLDLGIQVIQTRGEMELGTVSLTDAAGRQLLRNADLEPACVPARAARQPSSGRQPPPSDRSRDEGGAMAPWSLPLAVIAALGAVTAAVVFRRRRQGR